MLRANRAWRRRRSSASRLRERRQHVAGSEDRLYRRRDAAVLSRSGWSIGVTVSASVIGLTIALSAQQSWGIGSANAARAPQATLMATIIKGLPNQNLPWGLGADRRSSCHWRLSCANRVACSRVRVLPPNRNHGADFAGGLGMSLGRERRHRVAAQGIRIERRRHCSASGLIAGGSIAGILFAVLGIRAIGPFQSIGNAVPSSTAMEYPGQSRPPACFWRWRSSSPAQQSAQSRMRM